MTRTRLARPALLLVPALVAAGLTAAGPAPAATPRAGAAAVAAAAPAPAAESRTWEATYYSSPPALAEPAGEAEPRADRAAPTPPPTSGFVTGRVIGPGGKPVRQALVYGVRYSDLGLPVDFSEEERVVTRTTANG